MTAPVYSLAAWRNYQEQPEPFKHESPVEWTLAGIPADAEMDEGIVLGCWNGDRFVSWEKWLAATPVMVDPAPPSSALPEAVAYRATCGSTPVWLRKDGDRWLMFAGTQKSRRKDFASPFLEHAIRTAEAWYGPAASGWCPVEQVDARKEEAHAGPPQ